MKVRIAERNIALLEPFSYFLETLDHLPYAEIIAEDGDGVSGAGEIACSLDANGESQASAQTLAEKLNAVLADCTVRSAEDVARALELVDLHIAYNRATKCGLEQALFGIVEARAGTPLSALIGASWRPVKIQCAIPFLKDEKAYRGRFDELLSRKPRQVKFKVGKNLPLEAAFIRLLREAAPDVRISVDANQAFADAESAASFLSGLGVELAWAEQMLPKTDFDGWAELKRRTEVPLMADESIHTAADARPYLERKLVDFINIKLAKSGGIFEARKIAQLADAHGVPVMLGSMLHGEKGLRYNLAFGLTREFVAYDFYSYFSLAERGEPQLIDGETLEISEAVLR